MHLRRSLLHFLIIFGIFFIPLQGRSQSLQDADTVLAGKVIHSMLLNRKLKEIPAQLRSQFAQNPFQLPGPKNKQVLQEFDEAYRLEKLKDDFKNNLAKNLSGKYGEHIEKWLNNSTTQKVHHAEKEYYTLQGKRKRIIAMYELDRHPPSAQRQALVSGYIDSTSLLDVPVESSITIVRALLTKIGNVSSKRSFTDSQLNSMTSNFRSQIKANVSDDVNEQMQVTYYKIGDNTLKNYTSFWFTDAGKWLDDAISKSMKTTFQDASDRFLKSEKNDK